MIYKRPLRLTTLHFEQRFLIDDDTFILLTPDNHQVVPYSQSLDYTCQYPCRPVHIMAESK
jgi:hypothetical protein